MSHSDAQSSINGPILGTEMELSILDKCVVKT